MKKSKSFYRPLLSSCLLLTACQAPALNPSNQVPVAVSQNAISAPLGQVQIKSDGQFSRVSFVPPAMAAKGFATQALRRSDVTHYKMTITWPGSSSNLRSTTNVSASSGGMLAAPLTLDNIPVGNFRVIIIQAFAGANEIQDLRVGHVYNTSSTADYSATLTRKDLLLAETIKHFSNSSAAAPAPAIFNVWKANAAGTLSGLSALITSALTGKDPLALKSSELIAAIETKGDGSLPTAGELDVASAADLTFSYKVPVGYVLPEDTVIKLSLSTASSAVTEELPAQQAGTQSFEIPSVYLPATGTQTMTLRLLDETNQVLLTQNITLTPTGVQSGTTGSATNPLVLPTDLLEEEEDGLTFYVDPNNGVDTGDGTTDKGTTEATPWKTLSYARNQIKAINFGDQVPVLVMAAGTYTGGVTIDFPIQIIGAGNGSDPASNTVISGSDSGNGLILTGLHTKRIQLESLRVTHFSTGFELTGGGHYSLMQVAGSANTSVGLRMGTGASVEDLVIHGSEFNGNAGSGNQGQGIYIAKGTNDTTTYFDNVEIKNTQFNDNKIKGIYIEKLSNALFDGIEVKQSGTSADYNTNAGIDINLKYKNGKTMPDDGGIYQNITIQNSMISESGNLGSASDRQFPVAVCIKARDDSPSYNSTPASLSNVQIINTQISGPVNALRFGEPGKNNAGPVDVVIKDSQLSLEGMDELSRYALINVSLAAIDATDGNTLNGLTVSEANAFALESTIFDKVDNSAKGRVNIGLGEHDIYVPFQEDATHIQVAINAAQAGDTIHLQAAPEGESYKPAPTLMIDVNKDITLTGEGEMTLFERTAVAGTRYLFRLLHDGATLSNMKIAKQDTVGEHNLVYLQGNDLTVENMIFTGQYEAGDEYSFVNRAMEAAAGTGLVIRNNTISGLSQAAYINGAVSITDQMGEIHDNRVFNTYEAWVLDGAMIDFQRNSWSSSGTGASENDRCDIAMFDSHGDLGFQTIFNNFYEDIAALEAANGGDLLPAGSGMSPTCDQRVIP